MTENLPRLAQAVLLLSVLWAFIVLTVAILDHMRTK
jgi:hypothetical protein